ncbi:hypothetical protein [Paramuribaculum intestinale]|uniref:hypothetical protein n=1 Tax=Paramuribaculum intestinale TaxID=2094151 RepID=UPI0025B2B3F6|nr:hypothetical protein [Paramuribaculum intestinale]
MTKATEIFKGPYSTDGIYIYDCNNQMCLMAGDCENYPEQMLGRICEILNNTKPTKGNPAVSVEDGHIYLNGDLILVVRGWGYLTGAGCLNLSNEEALKIQDEFAQHVVNCLRGEA